MLFIECAIMKVAHLLQM